MGDNISLDGPNESFWISEVYIFSACSILSTLSTICSQTCVSYRQRTLCCETFISGMSNYHLLIIIM